MTTDRQTQLRQKALDWIARNPDGYALLTHRSLAKTQKEERFSIRQLCESLRWEEEHGLRKGETEFAIPNELTRYIGLSIMDQHPQTEEYMTTRRPKTDPAVYPQPVDKPVDIPRGVAGAVAGWTLEVLAKSPLVLCWFVDLELSLGIPPEGCEPDVYPDRRFADLIDRMKSRLKISKGETDLVMMIKCRAGFRYRGEREHTRVEYQGNTSVSVSEWTQHSPPVGRWALVPANSSLIADNTPLPDSYFTDGIPF
jgi:hypothetical protein